MSIPQKPQPRAYHHGDLRNALLGTARSLIEEKGTSSLAIREIARRVGITPPAAYHHFKNLDAISVGLAEVAANEIISTIKEAAVGQPSPLMGMGKAYVAFARKNPQLYRLLFGDGLSIDSPARAEVELIRKRVYKILEGFLASQSETSNVYHRGIFIWSVAHGISLLLIDNQISDDGADNIIDDVFKLTGKALRA